MAVTLFVVRATITPEQEDAFDHWYHHEHMPMLLQYNGAVSARRYKKIMGDEKFKYVAVYEFASEEVFNQFMESDHLAKLKSEYDANFGDTSEREGFGYVQVWP